MGYAEIQKQEPLSYKRVLTEENNMFPKDFVSS